MDGRFNVFLRELTEQFPYVFHLLTTPYRATVMVNHPDTVKILMKSSEPKDTQFAGGYRHMKPWVGKIQSALTYYTTTIHYVHKNIETTHHTHF